MNTYLFVIFSAIVTVQCQMYSMPYPRPCPCGLPPMPANPPCASPIFTAPYELPKPQYELPIPIPAPVPQMVYRPAPYELPRPVPTALPRMAVPAAYEPVQTVVPNIPVMPAPYELALPLLSMPKPSCGCSEVGIPRPVPELPGLPISNPFLPAASPVSALAPFSPLLPPISTCSRCQYLKKIPIPPPCI